MATKRRQRLALMAKMRSLQQKRKGKQKVLLHSHEEEEEEEEEEGEGEEPHEENETFVTFVEELDSDKEREGGMWTTIAEQRPNLERVQFHLDNGRVDIAEVFDHLNAFGLQYESKPGIWLDLKSMKSGKSAKKFKNMQEVHIRKTSLSSWWSPQRKGPWVDKWLVEGDTRKIYCARVSRLSCENGAKVVGTTIRFENPYGLLLTTHHCCTFTNEESGKLLTRNDLVAYNTPVEVVHLSNKYDLAFLLLKSGPYMGGFHLATRAEEKRGREVRMLSFPWRVDHAFGFDHGHISPTEVHGHIANLGPKDRKFPILVDALATYMGGFVASPGGAVTINSKVLVGMHIRAIWHKKDEIILPFKERRKKYSQSGRQECSRKENCGEVSNQREFLIRKKRKRISQSNYCGKENSQASCSHVEASNRKQSEEQNLPNQVQRDNASKCNMYHGYMSTYLSASHIKEEYDKFVVFWRMGNFSKRATRREANQSHYVEEENHPLIMRRR